MHRFIFRWRFLALAAPLAALTAFMFFAGGAPKQTLAAGGMPGATPNLTGTGCADTYIGATPSGVTMTRIEPHNGTTIDTQWDVTTVSYLGADVTFGDEALDSIARVPDGRPAPVSCQTAITNAGTGAETNRFGGATQVPYVNQYGVRPTALGTYTECLSNGPISDCSGKPDHTGFLKFSVCAYSESEGSWVRVDSATYIAKVAAGTANVENDGTGTLWLGASAPDGAHSVDTNGDGVKDAALDGTDCSSSGATPFVYTSNSFSRQARTDHWAASVGACGTDAACIRNVNLSIGQDPDGPHPKVKLTDQTADSSDTLADDWDGDGCPDWDELDHQYMPGSLPLTYPPSYTWSTNPVNGMDPFNPYDCNLNYTATMSMSVTITSPINGHNTGGATSGQIAANCTTGGSPDCNYFGFRCLGSFTDAKTGAQRALAYKLGCYSDSSVTTVNSTLSGSTACPPAPREQCGDGKAGAAPPGCIDTPTAPSTCFHSVPCEGTGCAPTLGCPSLPCTGGRFIYTGIDPATYPVTDAGPSANYFDTTTNLVHLGGCFAGFGGGAYGNVYGSSAIDAHTGVGSFDIYIGQTDTCDAAHGAHLTGQVTIVVLRTEKGLTAAQKYDSDGDGCADAQELLNGTNAQSQGGFRDPWNPWDYFNPEKVGTPNSQGGADISFVVAHYNKNQGNAAYTTDSDRTGVLGGQAWSAGAPDGKVSGQDITVAVNQYNNNCAYSAP